MLNNAPTNRGDINSLQYGRGMAALLVCLFHSYGLIDDYFGPIKGGKIFRAGHSGVEFFFILSGFIILLAHKKDIGQVSRLRNFLIKRCVRILPMFWLVVIPLGLLFLAKPQFGENRELTVWKFLIDLVLIPRGGILTLAPAWTLQHEAIFYLIFSLIIFSRWVGIVAFVAWQLACLAVLVFDLTPQNYLLPINKVFGVHNFGFAVGMLIAIFYMSESFDRFKPRLRTAGLIVLPFIALMFLGEWSSDDAWLGGGALLTLCYFSLYGILILALLSLSRRPRPILDATIGLLGGASYVLYLIHEPLGSVVIKVLEYTGLKERLTPEGAYIVIIVSTVVVAVLVHLVVERPVLNWLRQNIFNQKKTAVTSVVAEAEIGGAHGN